MRPSTITEAKLLLEQLIRKLDEPATETVITTGNDNMRAELRHSRVIGYIALATSILSLAMMIWLAVR